MCLESKGLNGTSVLARSFRSAYTAEEGRGNNSYGRGSCSVEVCSKVAPGDATWKSKNGWGEEVPLALTSVTSPAVGFDGVFCALHLQVIEQNRLPHACAIMCAVLFECFENVSMQSCRRNYMEEKLRVDREALQSSSVPSVLPAWPGNTRQVAFLFMTVDGLDFEAGTGAATKKDCQVHWLIDARKAQIPNRNQGRHILIILLPFTLDLELDATPQHLAVATQFADPETLEGSVCVFMSYFYVFFECKSLSISPRQDSQPVGQDLWDKFFGDASSCLD